MLTVVKIYLIDQNVWIGIIRLEKKNISEYYY